MRVFPGPRALAVLILLALTLPAVSAARVGAGPAQAPPALTINDVSVVEGNLGFTTALFTISLSAASAQPVFASLASADGTATRGSDYLSSMPFVSFSPGETSRPVVVTILSDTTPEADETFFLNLSSPMNATIEKARGVGTIMNDDQPPTMVYLPVIATRPLPPRLAAVADTFVSEGRPTSTFGGGSSLWTGNHRAFCTDSSSSSGASRSLVRFDLSGLRTDVPIAQATLHLYAVGACWSSRSSAEVTALRVAQEWSEQSATWETQPETAEEVSSFSVPLDSNVLNWYTLDVTAVVRQWLSGQAPNHGLMLRTSESGEADFVFLAFGSRSWEDFAPYIEIEYGTTPAQLVAPAAAAGAQTGSCGEAAPGVMACTVERE